MGYKMIFRTQLSKMLLMCGAGLSVQMLASGFELTPIDKMLQMAVAEASDGHPFDEGVRQIQLALVDQANQKCEAAKRHAIEVAPELLALAAWPLDDSEPAECLGIEHQSVATIDDALPEAIEITDSWSVVSVMAADFGSQEPALSQAPLPPLPNEPHQPLGQQLAAIDAASLDEIRGGFELDGTGLKFSFGIERAVYINGELIASTVLNLKDLKLATGAGSAPAALPPGAGGAIGIIQNGTGNNVSTVINPNLAGTIIQNTLNDQKIQNVTTINASVNSLQTMRAMSVQSAIQSGIVSSLRR